ncbi:MAG: FAD-dependent oxidoreductase, partial [Planctomycetales bacterium]|nr:FAD-dependent oxidoreductase [Planctomycetales bacterium]
MRIAVVGSGISGLFAAYRLDRRHDVTLFEAADYPGGHTNTVDVKFDGRSLPVDTGFIVFNDWTYPNFIALLDELGVASRPTSMGFSVRCDR